MTNKQIFIATHLGAGGSMLVDMISANRRIGRMYRDATQTYTDPIALDYIQRKTLDINPQARMFVDRIVFNHELAHKSFYTDCLFIFLVREPEATIGHLIKLGYTEKSATRYYSYRLRRLCEMAKQAKHKIAITWDELINKEAFPEIKSLLGIKELSSIYKPIKNEKTVDASTVFSCRQCYERHLKYLKIITAHRKEISATVVPV